MLKSVIFFTLSGSSNVTSTLLLLSFTSETSTLFTDEEDGIFSPHLNESVESKAPANDAVTALSFQ